MLRWLGIFVLVLGTWSCSSEPEAPAPDATPPEAPAENEGAETKAEPEAEPEAAPEEPVEIVASLGAFSGKVTVNKKPAKEGQELAQGDEIQTKKKGQADVVMTDGSRVRLGPNARLKLEAIGRERVSVNLILGKLYSLITPATPYEVTTTNAVAGVRGTKFFVEAKKKKSYFCVCEGQVAVKGLKDDEETLLEVGEELFASKKKNSPKKSSKEQMIDSVNSVFDEMSSVGEESEE